jgi:hypothetical protein
MDVELLVDTGVDRSFPPICSRDWRSRPEQRTFAGGRKKAAASVGEAPSSWEQRMTSKVVFARSG